MRSLFLALLMLAVLYCLSMGLLLGRAAARQNEKGYSVEHGSEFVHVKRDGALIATYHILSGTKPIVWPLVGVDGVEMTRKWPMSDEDAKEKKDHPHIALYGLRTVK